MTLNETGIFDDMRRYLEAFGDPPAIGDPASEAWWQKASEAMDAFSRKWRGHPLAMEMGPGVYWYIECKAKAKRQ